MRAVSEASPVVGLSNHGIFSRSAAHASLASFNLTSFYYSVNDALFYILSAWSEGRDGSKLASLQITALSCKTLKA